MKKKAPKKSASHLRPWQTRDVLSETADDSNTTLTVTRDSFGRLVLIEEAQEVHMGVWSIRDLLKAMRIIEQDQVLRGDDYGRGGGIVDRLKKLDQRINAFEVKVGQEFQGITDSLESIRGSCNRMPRLGWRK